MVKKKASYCVHTIVIEQTIGTCNWELANQNEPGTTMNNIA